MPDFKNRCYLISWATVSIKRHFVKNLKTLSLICECPAVKQICFLGRYECSAFTDISEGISALTE